MRIWAGFAYLPSGRELCPSGYITADKRKITIRGGEAYIYDYLAQTKICYSIF